nr:uncharacterized protein LOC106782052 [Equus caballus]
MCPEEMVCGLQSPGSRPGSETSPVLRCNNCHPTEEPSGHSPPCPQQVCPRQQRLPVGSLPQKGPRPPLGYIPESALTPWTMGPSNSADEHQCQAQPRPGGPATSALHSWHVPLLRVAEVGILPKETHPGGSEGPGAWGPAWLHSASPTPLDTGLWPDQTLTHCWAPWGPPALGTRWKHHAKWGADCTQQPDSRSGSGIWHNHESPNTPRPAGQGSSTWERRLEGDIPGLSGALITTVLGGASGTVPLKVLRGGVKPWRSHLTTPATLPPVGSWAMSRRPPGAATAMWNFLSLSVCTFSSVVK